MKRLGNVSAKSDSSYLFGLLVSEIVESGKLADKIEQKDEEIKRILDENARLKKKVTELEKIKSLKKKKIKSRSTSRESRSIKI